MNAFIRKLRHGARLTDDDEALLLKLAGPEQAVDRGDIVTEGTEPRHVVVVLEGWACRYKHLENGRRQITSVLVPGDLGEPFGMLPHVLDHSLAALTPALLAYIPVHAMRSAAQASHRIEKALWWELLLANAIAREHLVSLGRRTATERLAHFLCEIHLRLNMVGLAERSSCEVPFTQSDFADLVGLSAVHVNRSIQELRRSGLISLRERRLTIHDMRALQEFSLFNPTYFPAHGATLAAAVA